MAPLLDISPGSGVYTDKVQLRCSLRLCAWIVTSLIYHHFDTSSDGDAQATDETRCSLADGPARI